LFLGEKGLNVAAHPDDEAVRRYASALACGQSGPITPNIIEDQVTYPIVSTLLAAPHVKAVRTQTAFGGSYIFLAGGHDLFQELRTRDWQVWCDTVHATISRD